LVGGLFTGIFEVSLTLLPGHRFVVPLAATSTVVVAPVSFTSSNRKEPVLVLFENLRRRFAVAGIAPTGDTSTHAFVVGGCVILNGTNVIPSVLYSTANGSAAAVPASLRKPNVKVMPEYPSVLIPEIMKFLTPDVVKNIFPDPLTPG
jgi:hypothetical protein